MSSYGSSISVVGGCGIGMTMKMERVPGAGETVSGASFATGPGGKGSNQAIAARRLGAEVALFSIVGPDDHGRMLRALWRSEGVDDASVLIGSAPTMVGSILVDANGENRVIVAPGALAELTASSISSFAPRIEAGAALLVSLEVPVETAAAALACARAAGVATVLNAAPATALPAEARAQTDHLIPNRSEAALLTGRDPAEPGDALVDALRAEFSGTIVMTIGSEGVLVDDGSNREHVAAVEVETVVDSTGAGDAFCAAYTTALVEGAEPIEAARFATHAGAFAVTVDEVVPALPHRVDLPRLAAATGRL
ncbi:MAG TPA: ribokinase [Gaiellaceae bacterium]|nr:ribokinase [Gaiellaceae bacterium]